MTDDPRSDPKFILPQRLAQARRSKGWNQTALAIASGVSQPQISHFEGGRRLPSARNLAVLARALGVSSDSLLGLEPLPSNCVVPNEALRLARVLEIRVIRLEAHARIGQSCVGGI